MGRYLEPDGKMMQQSCLTVTCGGVRGSYPVADSSFMGVGGDTTSFLIRSSGGKPLLVDAGTGIRRLGSELGSREESGAVCLLMTHYHLDHITGLPSFGPLYEAGRDIVIAAPRHEEFQIDQVMAAIVEKPFWPVQIKNLGSRIRFADLEGRGSLPDDIEEHFRLTWCGVRHPGGCTAYRIEDRATGAAVVVATDMEWPASSPAEQQAFLALCTTPTPAGLLIMDGQYNRSNYKRYRGWGHSCWEDVVDRVREWGVKQGLVTHHDPSMNDENLAAVESGIRAAAENVGLARVGDVVQVV